jgi:hypothetical protein
MRLSNVLPAMLLSCCLLATEAYADLDSPTYSKAKEEYAKGKCLKASSLLEKYRKEDSEFLKKNPSILTSINNAIDYCNTILFPYLTGTSYPTGPPQPPDLPGSIANTFDSEARLRDVIGQIKSGKPNYDLMEPMVRVTLRQQLQTLAKRLQGLGDLVSVSREGEQQDADVYEVKFANGTTAWMIGIAPNGRIRTLVCQ